MIQRRAARRISQVYVTYPPGPLARPDGFRGGPGVGQRVPDVRITGARPATTLHGVLRAAGTSWSLRPLTRAVLHDPR